MMMGGTLLGLRVLEARRLVDFLAGQPQVDIQRLGAMGISGGGMHTFFSTCLDRRIKACVISGYFCSWFDSILAMNHCICNFVPEILKLGDLPDLAGLLAPRPTLIEAGTKDEIFPIQAVKRDTEKLRDLYKLWNAADKVEIDEFEGRHQISGRRAYQFLKQYL
jgi:predicted esterase